MTLTWLPALYAVSRLEPSSDVPSWAWEGGFASVTRTVDEISVVCEESVVPSDVRAERGWSVLKLEGPMDLCAVGVLAKMTKTLAEAGLCLFAVSTFDTDYVLVKAEAAEMAGEALRRAGYEVRREAGGGG